MNVLVVLWLASLGLDWPQFPYGVRVSDLAFGVVALMVWSRKGRPLPVHVLDVAVLAYLAAGLIGLVESSDRNASLVELSRHVYLAALYVTVVALVLRGHVRLVQVGLMAMGVVLALPALVAAMMFLLTSIRVPAMGEVMNVPYVGDVLRVRAFTASPAMFASLLVIATPLVLARYARRPTAEARRWTGGLLLALAVALFMTFSHVWPAVLLACAITIWPWLTQRPALKLTVLAATLALAAAFNATLIASVRNVSSAGPQVAPAASYAHAVGSGRVQVGGYAVDYTVMSYFRIKQLAWEAFRARPLTGVGLDRFHDVSEQGYRDGRLPHMYRAIDPHSALLGRLAETGIIGGLTLLGLWAAAIYTGLRPTPSADSWERRAALGGLAGLILAGINVDIMNFRFFWVALGLLRGLAEKGHLPMAVSAIDAQR